MATVNTNDLRVKNAKNLIDSFTGPDLESLAYLFVGRVQPWPDDNAPPTPQNNFKEFYRTYDDLFALKDIRVGDAFHMIPKFNWQSGLIYDYYRQDYSDVNKTYSGASNLYEARWIVRNQSNVVYICLYNNNNSRSTVEPLNTSNEPFYTSDGYQWQRVYTLTSSVYNSASTDNLMPIESNNVVVTEDGAISTVIIENGGAGFTVNPVGAPNNIPFYFCAIDGDGEGAVAKVVVSGGAVTDIEVVRQGSGYSYGTLNFVANNVYESLGNLDLRKNALNPGGDGTLRTTVIIPPPGGWGTDLPRELGGTRVGVFGSLDFQLFDYFLGSFRQVGILQNAQLNTPNTDSVNACYCLRVEPTDTIYLSGETIAQTVEDENGNLHTAKGVVISYDRDLGVVRYSQNSTTVDTDGKLYRFTGTGDIIGLTSGVVGKVDDFTGEVTDVDFTNGYATPDLTVYSGLMTYLANVSPVTRDPLQSERISIVIAF